MTRAQEPVRRDLPLKTIVVGYDGTHPAERALARAAQLARTFGSRVIVADVAAPEPLHAMPGAFGLMPYYGLAALSTAAPGGPSTRSAHLLLDSRNLARGPAPDDVATELHRMLDLVTTRCEAVLAAS